MEDLQEPRPELATYEDLAQRIDHAVLMPGYDDEQTAAGIRLAIEYGVAAVFVRPSDADLAVRLLEGTQVKPASVVGFPHGGSTTAVKVYETRDLLRRGVKEIDVVLNIGKLLSRQFQYVEMEAMQIAKACHEEGAIVKLIFENEYLSEDLKVIAGKVAKRTEADFAATSTGFGSSEWVPDDLVLMKRVLKDYCRVKASSGVRTLEGAQEAWRLGADRIGTTQTAAILESWKQELAARAAAAAAVEPTS